MIQLIQFLKYSTFEDFNYFNLGLRAGARMNFRAKRDLDIGLGWDLGLELGWDLVLGLGWDLEVGCEVMISSWFNLITYQFRYYKA